MKVYTYFEPVASMPQPQQRALLDLWYNSWSRFGWTPVVLGRRDAMRNSELFAGVSDAIAELPTLNAREYEDACYLRWVAMEAIGGGVMTDYDVMNYGFLPPKDYTIPTWPKLLSKEGHVPSVVYGSADHYRLVCEAFITFNPYGFNHVSDMIVLENRPDLFQKTGGILQYGEPGWREYDLVHFSASALHNIPGRSKAEKIQRVRPIY